MSGPRLRELIVGAWVCCGPRPAPTPAPTTPQGGPLRGRDLPSAVRPFGTPASLSRPQRASGAPLSGPDVGRRPNPRRRGPSPVSPGVHPRPGEPTRPCGRMPSADRQGPQPRAPCPAPAPAPGSPHVRNRLSRESAGLAFRRQCQWSIRHGPRSGTSHHVNAGRPWRWATRRGGASPGLTCTIGSRRRLGSRPRVECASDAPARTLYCYARPGRRRPRPSRRSTHPRPGRGLRPGLRGPGRSGPAHAWAS